MLATADPDTRFELVPFQGTEILAARRDDAVFVPMKRFCGSLGLKWDGARRRIERDEVLREGAVIMTVPTAGGDQAQQTLPLDLIPGFLFGLEAKRYAPDLRDRITAWRRECYGALFRHFFAGSAAEAMNTGAVITSAPLPPAAARVSAICQAAEIAARLQTTPAGPVRSFLLDAMTEICALIGMPAPLVPLEPATGPDAAERIDQLLAGLATLDARGVRYNHLGATRPGSGRRIALNLPQLTRLFARHDIDVQIDDAMREALRTGTRRWRCGVATIDSKLSLRRRPTLCHVLEWSVG